MGSDVPATSADRSESERRSPTKAQPPTLREIASRFNMLATGVEHAKETRLDCALLLYSPSATQNLKRLGLAGRLELAASSNVTSEHAPSRLKEGSMPSLSDIRARLNQRGIDITPSAWSPKKKRPSVPPEDENGNTKAKAIQNKEKEAPVNESISSDMIFKSDSMVGEDASKNFESSSDVVLKDDAVASCAEHSPTALPSKTVASDAPSTHTPVAKSGREAALDAKKGIKHPLQNEWTLYYDLQRHHGSASSDQYEATLKRVGHFTTVESFFDTFATLHRPSRLERNSNYHLFKNGIKPLWEDPANSAGGRWVLTWRDRGQTAGSRAGQEALLDRSWMWLVLALIGETLDDDDTVTGAVCSLRSKGNRITVWTRKKDPAVTNKLGKKLLDMLELQDEPCIQMDFSVNDGSKDRQEAYIRKNMSKHATTPPTNAHPSQDSMHASEPALGSWLGSDATLHPADHMRYYEHVKQSEPSL